jgi:hypothetical protein
MDLPNCEMPSMRYWNVQHHISSRRHVGRDKPYNHDIIQYNRLQQYHIAPASRIPDSDSGQESYKKFDLFMDRMIKQYIKLIEFKNLCAQLYKFTQ